jgi:recombination protein RecR
MGISPLIDRLIEAFQVLPGVGPKGAQRMVLHLLQHNRAGGSQLAEALAESMSAVGQCERCRTLCETTLCRYCADTRRLDCELCVVESPADIFAIEQAGSYRGRYFVLNGRLSPIDGIGPEELGMARLEERVRELMPEEVILATNPTVEGEATAHYVSELLRGLVGNITRIAHGVPLGGELEYIDGGTIVHALQGRRSIS